MQPKISYASKFYLAALCSKFTRNGIGKPFDKDSMMWRLIRLIPTFEKEKFFAFDEII